MVDGRAADRSSRVIGCASLATEGLLAAVGNGLLCVWSVSHAALTLMQEIILSAMTQTQFNQPAAGFVKMSGLKVT